jgi:hypothetical protein
VAHLCSESLTDELFSNRAPSHTIRKLTREAENAALLEASDWVPSGWSVNRTLAPNSQSRSGSRANLRVDRLWEARYSVKTALFCSRGSRLARVDASWSTFNGKEAVLADP